MAGMRSRHRYHCRSCRKAGDPYRFTLQRALSWYRVHKKRKPVCPRCRGDDFYSYEKIYVRAQDKRRTRQCRCGGVPHPHVLRKDGTGSHKLCVQYDRGRIPDWRDDDLESYARKLFESVNKKGSKTHRRTAFA